MGKRGKRTALFTKHGQAGLADCSAGQFPSLAVEDKPVAS